MLLLQACVGKVTLEQNTRSNPCRIFFLNMLLRHTNGNGHDVFKKQFQGYFKNVVYSDGVFFRCEIVTRKHLVQDHTNLLYVMEWRLSAMHRQCLSDWFNCCIADIKNIGGWVIIRVQHVSLWARTCQQQWENSILCNDSPRILSASNILQTIINAQW